MPLEIRDESRNLLATLDNSECFSLTPRVRISWEDKDYTAKIKVPHVSLPSKHKFYKKNVEQEVQIKLKNETHIIYLSRI